MTVEISIVRGAAIAPWVDALAALRIRVFRDWPYLYDGTLAYEQAYLQRYVAADQAVMVLAQDGEVLVGASSGLPLRDADPEFQQPFLNAVPALDEIFYFGESVLLPGWRGQGLGHRFFDEREAFARQCGYGYAVFCAVQRPPDHPARPAQARDLAPFWRGRGYTPLDGRVCTFHWTDVGDRTESIKPMQFWDKRL